MENQRALSLSKTLPRHRHRPKKKERKRCNVFVPVVLVISHSDAYLLRSSTPLLTKWGEQKMCSGVVVRFGEKCALVWFFSPEFIRPKKFSFLRCRLQNKTHQKRGISLSSHTNRIESASEKCNAEEARVNNNELSCCWYRRERDRFLLSATTFSEYSLLVERVSRRAIVHLFKRVSNFFSPLLSVLTGQSRERKNHKNHVDEHIGRKNSRLNRRKLKRRTCKECPPVFQHDYKNIK